MLAPGVVGPRIDTSEESWPKPTRPLRCCSTSWLPWDPPQGREVAAALRSLTETFAGVPDGRDTAHALGLLAHLIDSG
jgi:hypothetical protein